MTPPRPILIDSSAWSPSRQDLVTMVLLSYISFLTALDSTVLVAILPLITHQLHGTTTDAFWAGTSYLLTSAISQPFIVALSDLFGSQWKILWVSVLTFAGASLICAMSRSFVPLLAGRFLQGIGGGGMIALVQIIFARLVPTRQRPRWFLMVIAAQGVGSVIGPFVGSQLVQTTSFHWAFWINLPLCGIALLLIPFFIPPFTARMAWDISYVDWVGAILLISSTTSILLGLSWGGVAFAWTSRWMLLAIVPGIFGILGFNVWEHNFARAPVLQISLFNSRAVLAAYLCAFLQGLTLLCLLYHIPFYFASVQRRTAMQSSVRLLPLLCSFLLSLAIVSQYIDYTGRHRWILWSGSAIATLGSGLLLLLDETTTTPVWVVVLLLLGLGNGVLLSAINFSIQVLFDPQNAVSAMSMHTFFRSLGMAVGLAVAGNVFQNVMAHRLQLSGLSGLLARNAEGFVPELRIMDEADPTLHTILQAYKSGFHGVSYLLLGVSGVGLAISILI